MGSTTTLLATVIVLNSSHGHSVSHGATGQTAIASRTMVTATMVDRVASSANANATWT
ncbi:MAG: hypothetical protein M9890_00235 [Thermomicrobiales bacterium]|nr:hypothetical protein [Thermomicrobiales bacterium]